MKKSKHLNPVLTSPLRKQNYTERKVRKDKLHDIKIPITENMDLVLRRESRKFWGGSKTAIGTEIFTFGLKSLFNYSEVAYKDSPFTVHVKIDHDTYEELGSYATLWKCSARKAAHRIFMEAYLKKQYGGITSEEL